MPLGSHQSDVGQPDILIGDPALSPLIGPAVEIRDLSKRYRGGPPVLDNLCMNVRKGAIYGLLGSSGCGKTTLLSCIVGIRKWDTGDVLVFGHRPGTKASGIPGKRLGYMPQDLALYEQLSIQEMIRFFARLYNMTSSEFTERWCFLLQLLKLPAKFRLIKNLSGGQKRRVSLALALLHSPELLILDEPTVGLDPVLRRSIWNHLHKIVTTLHTTIVVTTHYIEESRFAHQIGVMRKGRLLVEDSPVNLLQQFGSDLLEDVVLRLCHQDETGVLVSTSVEDSSSNEVNDCVGDTAKEEQMEKMTQNNIFIRLSQSIEKIYGFVAAMRLMFFRSPVFLFLMILWPSLNGILAVLVLGTKPYELRFGVVNHENPKWEEACLQKSNLTGCDVSMLSCTYLNLLAESNVFYLVNQRSEEEALQEVHKGRLWGYLVFSANFSQDTVDMIAARRFALEEAIEGSRIPVRMDVSQFAGAMLMVKELYAVFFESLRTVANSCGIGGKEIEIPLDFRQPVYGKSDDNFTEFILPGLIVFSTFTVGCSITAILVIFDRRLGILSRVHVAGLRDSEIMISHMITQAWIVLLQVALYTLVLHLFGYNIEGSGWLFTVIIVGTGISSAVIGILLGAVTSTELEILTTVMILFPIQIMYGDIVWPTDGLSFPLKVFANILPASLPVVKSLRSVITRGVGITHASVWPGLVSLACWLMVSWLIGMYAIRKMSKQ